MQNQSNRYSTQSSGREQRTGEGSSKLADKASQAAEQVKSAAVERVQSARDRAETGITQGRTQVADRIRHVSSALRSASDHLREDDDFIAGYVETASERVDRIASYVNEANPRDVLRDVEDFARQRPAWFFGGAFLLGLAAGRFLKASTDNTLELGDEDIEDLGSGYRRAGYAARPGYGQPITPSATIPVTQGGERNPTASPSMSGSPSGSLAGSTGYGGTARTPGASGTGAGQTSSGTGSAGLSGSSLGGTGTPGTSSSAERDIFDIPGAPSGVNKTTP
jgi:hypothetical protein